MNKCDVRAEVENILQGTISQGLIEELVSDYIEQKHLHQIGDYKSSCAIAGQFFESCMKVLLFKAEIQQTFPKGIQFEKVYEQLKKHQCVTLEDELVGVLIPRILRGGYSIRNKKRISHARGYKPEKRDSVMLSTISDWAIVEFVNLLNPKKKSEIESLTEAVLKPKIPAMEKVAGGYIFLDKKLSTRLAILSILIEHGDEIEKYLLTRILGESQYSNSSISKAISRAVKNREIVLKGNKIYLTSKGRVNIINGMR